MNTSAIFKSILFTVFIPGTVAIFFPYLLIQYYPDHFDNSILYYLGLVILLLGIIFYLLSVLSFIDLGGTPQIYFMKKIEKIFGLEPDQLAQSGIYNFSRNPMYAGVALTTFGVGLILQSPIIVLWAVIFFGLTNIVVILIEEPHLKSKYGESYEIYYQKTPRWIGIQKKK